jgi:hypothetical protein
MIKEKLNELISRNIDNNVSEKISFIKDNYDENELTYILSNGGFQINDNIILHYFPGIGFKCYDVNERYFGKSPLSQNIERFLNRKTN